MKKYAVSDIHGCLKTFKTLLEKLSFSKDDQLYLLGDYIDRGPDSKGVIDYIWQLQTEGYTVNCLRGNHEVMYLYCYEGGDDRGGYHYDTLKSFNIDNFQQTPLEYILWMQALPYYFEVDEFLLVHAGFNFRQEDPLSDKENMVWVRYWYDQIEKPWLGSRIIIHGHTPTALDEIFTMPDNFDEIPVLNIDNGCVYDYPGLGRLLAFELTERRLFMQKRMDVTNTPRRSS